MLECVVNVSEGRRRDVVDAISDACRAVLLNVHCDGDHHRSVFTLASDDVDALMAGVHALIAVAVADIDLGTHHGVHPRLGAVDVVPYVPLDPVADRAVAVAAARSTAGVLANALHVPVFFYGDADAQHRSLPSLRASAFRTRAPDLGPPEPHATAGATAVGVRPPLVAVNCELATDNVDAARAIAVAVRERDGGLPGVRALGFVLASREIAQVSMNLVDLGATGLEAACAAVEGEARRHATEVVAVELVGLVPQAEADRCSAPFAARIGLADRTIEGRVAALRTR